MLLAADRINVVEGIGEDLRHGRIPNIPAEMGIRSELQHNRPGFIRKVAVTGAVVAVIYALISSRTAQANRQRFR